MANNEQLIEEIKRLQEKKAEYEKRKVELETKLEPLQQALNEQMEKVKEIFGTSDIDELLEIQAKLEQEAQELIEELKSK